jgi:hypothetical protein
MPAASRIVAFVLMAFLLALPALGADEKDKKAEPKKDDAPKKTEVKKDDAPKKTAVPKSTSQKTKDADKEPINTEKMMKAGSVVGKVLNAMESKKSIRLQLTIPYGKLNPGALQSLQQAQINLMRATSPQGVLQAQQQIARAQATLVEIRTTTKEVEWTAADDVKVRMANPPVQFDDRGQPKKYTQKELREMRGEDKLFPAEFSDLKQDQIVQVTLVRKKGVPPRRPVKKGKDVDPDLLADYLPQMAKIVILAEPRN